MYRGRNGEKKSIAYLLLPQMPAWCVEPDMGGVETVVCVKKVRQGLPEEEWDESMPLPGDIIESVAAVEDMDDDSFSMAPPVTRKSELTSRLSKLSRSSEAVWIKVRRGNTVLKLKARVIPERNSKLQRRFTLRASRDERHVAVVADLSLDQCSELQEMSRRLVNVDGFGFDKSKGIQYDWKKAVGTYLPDRHSTVVSSIIFLPISGEHGIKPIITRSMAWFSAAVSSGVPLIFVNIQTEQIVTSDKNTLSSIASSKRQLSWGRQQSSRTSNEVVRGVRIWFLPGVAEVLVILALGQGETRFGVDIKRTEEGFMRISSVSNGSAADRAGLQRLCHEANSSGHLVVVSRLDGSCLLPPLVSSSGLIQCCSHADMKDRFEFAVEQMEDIRLRVMAWPNQRSVPFVPQEVACTTTLLPPASNNLPTFGRTFSSDELDKQDVGW